MTSILDEELVTIAEAARVLRVSPSTIRRWIGEGDLPAYRVGHRRVRVRKPDLARLITQPARQGSERAPLPGGEPFLVRPLTADEQRRALAAIEESKRLHAEQLAQRGGKRFSPSWILINEARDERSRDLS